MKKPNVSESTKYDNCLDISQRSTDKYGSSLNSLFKEEVNTPLFDRTRKKKSKHYFKSIYVHFRNLDDLADFCSRVEYNIPHNHNEIFFPIVAAKTLFDTDTKFVLDRDVIAVKKSPKTKTNVLVDTQDTDNKWQAHWKGMPEFEQETKESYKSITVKFRTESDYKKFWGTIEQKLSDKTVAIWHPKLEITKNRLLRWIQSEEDRINPKYPVYIVSKGRHDSMGTSRSLSRMRIPHYIVIEPQDFDNYDHALDKFKIRDYVTLLIAPFSNHGDGPGRARNWAWDHSISIGAASHWVLDDNIADFYRLHQNIRIRFETGVGFRVMEDFVDRYENIYIAGPQYRFFVAPDQKYPPFVLNTRIYSTLLIRNDCKHRWRGRYNEDTDICLRVMKDGDCTVQFNAFLQGKSATQTVKGGNTEEFYHVEGDLDKQNWREGRLNAEGTINKSQMLVDMHPDVTRLVWKYDRWHHYVDYSSFKKNKLILKSGIEIPDEPNNYGMRLIDNFHE